MKKKKKKIYPSKLLTIFFYCLNLPSRDIKFVHLLLLYLLNAHFMKIIKNIKNYIKYEARCISNYK
jgi:hypothetical protein